MEKKILGFLKLDFQVGNISVFNSIYREINAEGRIISLNTEISAFIDYKCGKNKFGAKIFDFCIYNSTL